VEKKVPEIRFDGFSGEWEDCNLKSLCSSFSYGLNASAIKFDGVNKYLRITDIDENSRHFDKSVLTSPGADLLKSDDYLLKSGDILFARTGASVGKTYIYNEQDGKVYFAGFLIRASVNDNVCAQFIFLSTQTHEYAKFVITTSQRSGQPGINANEYSEYRLFIPCEKEQTKIGNTFQKLDSLINQQQQKHDKLSSIKKAMLEKMFPKQGETIPEIRFKGFSGEWEEKNIDELCSISTGKNNTQDKVPEGKYPFYVRSATIERSNNYIFDEEAVLTVGDGVGTGRVYHYVNGKYDLHQRVYRMFDFTGIDAKYFYHYFSNNFYDRVMSMTAKTSVDSVRLDMIANMNILLPVLGEQKKIATFLNEIDTLINQHQQQITKLNNIKQACLSKMFV